MQPKSGKNNTRPQTPNTSPVSSRRVQSSVDPLERMGLNGFARVLGANPDAVLATTATMLSGIAGPEASLQAAWGPIRLPKLDLLTQIADSRMQRLVVALTEPLDLMNRRLATNMRRYDREALELLTKGPIGNSTAAKHADPGMRESVLRRHADALMAEPSDPCQSLLHHDLAFESVAHRSESLVHPQFLVRNGSGSSLKTLTEQCHMRTALVVSPRLNLDRINCKRTMRLLTTLLGGVTLAGKGGCGAGPTDMAMPAKAHAVLSLPKSAIEHLSVHELDACGEFLWVESGETATMKPNDAAASARFFEAYQQTAEKLLELRRAGRGPIIQFESAEARSEFEAELRLYETEIDGMAANPGPWARGLPQTLFWSLAFLSRPLSKDRPVRMEALQRVAFEFSRRLVAKHVVLVSSVADSEIIRDRCYLAGRIVEVVKADPPIKLCILVRSFGRQRYARFAPVIKVLMEQRVLVQDGAERYLPGPVEWDEVKENVLQIIRSEPIC